MLPHKKLYNPKYKHKDKKFNFKYYTQPYLVGIYINLS